MKYCLLVSLFTLSFSTNAALVSRLGGLAYYDTEADITWLADANYANTSGYTDTYLVWPPTGETYVVSGGGDMNWTEAIEWADQLSVAGVTGWRLSEADTTCNGIHGCQSEMHNLYFNVLGNTHQLEETPMQNSGPFSNVQAFYWLSTEYEQNPVEIYEQAYVFTMFGFQGPRYKLENSWNAWAVHDGDVGEVPLPAAAWLFGSAILGLGILKRNQTK